jgi:hypothetical protein
MTALALLRRGRAPRGGDGYPTYSGGGSGRGGENDPVEALAERLADDGEMPDPVDEAVEVVSLSLRAAKSRLEQAVEAMQYVADQLPAPAKPGCSSCARLRVFTEADEGKNGRCRWCYDHLNSNMTVDGQVVSKKGDEIPVFLLRIRLEESRKLTTRDLRQCLAEEIAERRAAKKKGKKPGYASAKA